MGRAVVEHDASTTADALREAVALAGCEVTSVRIERRLPLSDAVTSGVTRHRLACSTLGHLRNLTPRLATPLHRTPMTPSQRKEERPVAALIAPDILALLEESPIGRRRGDRGDARGGSRRRRRGAADRSGEDPPARAAGRLARRTCSSTSTKSCAPSCSRR